MKRFVIGLAVTPLLLLSACSDDSTDGGLPDVVVTQGPVRPGTFVQGYLVSVTDTTVVVGLAGGGRRSFDLPQPVPATLGLSHLLSHAGAPSIQFQVFYERSGDADVITGAYELSPQ